MNTRKSTVILGLDGLSQNNFEALVGLMPAASKPLAVLKPVTLSGHVLCSSQSVWAEILTGVPWFGNGCVGYARPTKSLNKLSVMTERELLVPPDLASGQGAPSVIVNVPLIRPDAGRLWLADGSLPINKIVSPASLLKQSPFADYQARPATNIAIYEEPFCEMVERCLNVELNRLECATALFERGGWSRFIYRVSAFDHLTHLLGLNYLLARDLTSFNAIKRFAERLAQFICLVSERSDVALSVVSGYSHALCKASINLNRIMEDDGLLTLDESLIEHQMTERVNSRGAAYHFRLNRGVVCSMEGCLKASDTIAASPISGCVFINRIKSFPDGSVAERDYKEVREDVRLYLHDRLARTFGNAFAIEERPGDAVSDDLALPEFIIHIDGVVFHNLLETRGAVPRTMHVPTGFALLPGELAVASDRLTLSQLKAVIGGSLA